MEKTRGEGGGVASELRGNKSSFLAILILRCLIAIQMEVLSRLLDTGFHFEMFGFILQGLEEIPQRDGEKRKRLRTKTSGI